VTCHVQGLNRLTESGLAAFVATGAELYVPRELRPDVDRLYLQDLNPTIEAADAAYAATVQAITASEPEDAVRALRAILQAYDEPVPLQKGARELGIEPERLKSYLLGGSDSARMASWPSRAISRKTWEKQFLAVLNGLDLIDDAGDVGRDKQP
jgi:hypothetical protein